METIYNILETVFPFNFMQYDFFKNAFIAVLIITPLFGVLGTMIVSKKMAFFSDALGHSAFTGMAIGIILGAANTNISMLAFAVIFALALNFIRSRNASSSDTVISVFASLATSIGLVILSHGGNFSKYSALLVGDILSIVPGELLWLLAIFAGTLVFWVLCFNRMHAISLNTSLAKSKKMNVGLYENLFAVLIALVVMVSIKWVGILIINALLILPAAASRNIASNMREYHLFSVMISMFSGVLGLIMSYFMNTAAGPTIVIIAAAVFFGTMLIRPLVRE